MALMAAPGVDPTVVATAGGRTWTLGSGAIRPTRVSTASSARSPTAATSHAVPASRGLVLRVSILALMVPSFTLAAGPAALRRTVGPAGASSRCRAPRIRSDVRHGLGRRVRYAAWARSPSGARDGPH